jgi:hypothetical protein
MKKTFYFTALLSITAVILFFISCDEFDLFGNDCEKDDKDRISATFLISVEIKYKDNVPFDGKVDYVIYKEECDGDQSGLIEATCGSNGNGLYQANYEPLYSLSNLRDKVIFGFIAHYEVVFPTGGSSEKTKELSYSFNYNAVKNASDDYDEVIKKYTMTIPTNSDGTE